MGQEHRVQSTYRIVVTGKKRSEEKRKKKKKRKEKIDELRLLEKGKESVFFCFFSCFCVYSRVVGAWLLHRH